MSRQFATEADPQLKKWAGLIRPYLIFFFVKFFFSFVSTYKNINRHKMTYLVRAFKDGKKIYTGTNSANNADVLPAHGVNKPAQLIAKWNNLGQIGAIKWHYFLLSEI